MARTPATRYCYGTIKQFIICTNYPQTYEKLNTVTRIKQLLLLIINSKRGHYKAYNNTAWIQTVDAQMPCKWKQTNLGIALPFWAVNISVQQYRPAILLLPSSFRASHHPFSSSSPNVLSRGSLNRFFRIYSSAILSRINIYSTSCRLS